MQQKGYAVPSPSRQHLLHRHSAAAVASSVSTAQSVLANDTTKTSSPTNNNDHLANNKQTRFRPLANDTVTKTMSLTRKTSPTIIAMAYHNTRRSSLDIQSWRSVVLEILCTILGMIQDHHRPDLQQPFQNRPALIIDAPPASTTTARIPIPNNTNENKQTMK